MHDEAHDGTAPLMTAPAAGGGIADRTVEPDGGSPPTLHFKERAHSLGAHLILKELIERQALRRRR